ncbi:MULTISPECIES: DUF1905 domain-containing protein [unclassified Nocardioides]|uniref:DUF1905 domain-containing protein n=1 Tax=unclassified Nocardioides TaxID=2615069 RepID=UPI0006F34278|nr:MULTISPECIES: DUF1905 domain-containing protein [unclassified Nocardioides]KRA30897.1 hypothetical protein ASD81_15450 [Nocardioides sp. Root614]KRA87517.1 hypothetical protein ASD84_15720 [Nocardioides sp. Root682]
MTEHVFTASLWRWAAKDEEKSGAWFFVSLPFDAFDALEAEAVPGKGFGSVKVEVTIGSSTWQTSVFPSVEEKTYVLPIKKAVRTAEGLDEGGSCEVRLRAV